MDFVVAIEKVEIMAFVGKWMYLEIIVLIQLNQPQKEKYILLFMNLRFYIDT